MPQSKKDKSELVEDLSLLLDAETNELYMTAHRGPEMPDYDATSLQSKKNRTRAEKLSAVAIEALKPSAPGEKLELESLPSRFKVSKYFKGDEMLRSRKADATASRYTSVLLHPAMVEGHPPRIAIEPQSSGCSRSKTPPPSLKPPRLPTIEAMRNPEPKFRMDDPIKYSHLAFLHYDIKPPRCFQCPPQSPCTFTTLFGACVECATDGIANCSYTASPDQMVHGYYAELAEKLDISTEQAQMLLYTLFEHRYVSELNLAMFQQHLRCRNEKHEEFRSRLFRIEQQMPPGYLPLAFEDNDALAAAMSSLRLKETNAPDFGEQLPSAVRIYDDAAATPHFKMMRHEDWGVLRE